MAGSHRIPNYRTFTQSTCDTFRTAFTDPESFYTVPSASRSGSVGSVSFSAITVIPCSLRVPTGFSRSSSSERPSPCESVKGKEEEMRGRTLRRKSSLDNWGLPSDGNRLVSPSRSLRCSLDTAADGFEDDSQHAREMKGFRIPSWETCGMFALFMTCGVLAIAQFSVVITAAEDLVGKRAPTGLVLFAYTIPSLVIRFCLPFMVSPSFSSLIPISLWGRKDYDLVNDECVDEGFITGTRESIVEDAAKVSAEVNYIFRFSICAICSFIGLELLAWIEYIPIRVLGIMLTSVSSNVGDMSFYQLATRYRKHPTATFTGYNLGSGAAGMLGSLIYTSLTSGFGVSPLTVLSLLGFAPTVVLIAYIFIFPHPQGKPLDALTQSKQEMEDRQQPPIIQSLPLATKLSLATPLFWTHMLPLALSLFIESLANTGILPTIVFHTPTGPFNFFHRPEDFFRTYVTVYQMAIFFGRATVLLPRLRLPSRVTAYILVLSIGTGMFALELIESLSMSKKGITDSQLLLGPTAMTIPCAVLGFTGGAIQANTYWRVSHEDLPHRIYSRLDIASDIARNAREEGGEVEKQVQVALREFLVSIVAPPDTVAIFLASILGMTLQRELCGLQIGAGRDLCAAVGGN